jgi:hypothetical protein
VGRGANKNPTEYRYSGTCLYCGKEFIAAHATRRYCSDECRHLQFRMVHPRKRGNERTPETPPSKHLCLRCTSRAIASPWHSPLVPNPIYLCPRCFALWERRWLNATREAGISGEEVLALMQFHIDEGRTNVDGTRT